MSLPKEFEDFAQFLAKKEQGQLPDEDFSVSDNLLELMALEEEMVNAEEYLKSIKRRRHELRSKVLPEKFAELEMDSVEAHGHKFTAKVTMVGGLPKDPVAHMAAVDLLERNGLESIVKRIVTVTMPKDASAADVDRIKDAAGPNSLVASKVSIHHMSYLSACKELMEQGGEFNPDVLGVKPMMIVSKRGKK